MAEPILELSSLIDRPRIAIDGKSYEILSQDELSVLDLQWFSSKGRAISGLMDGRDLSEIGLADLAALIDEVSDKIMVGVPDEVRAKLTGAQRMDIAEVFSELPNRTKATAALETLLSSIGEKQSQGSKGSTAAIPDGGSPRPQSH